jgi:DNA-binding MarR family transcriptional regulator
MHTNDKVSTLRFNGSVWCNLDIALRNLDQTFGQVVQPLGLTVIEWYIMRALYHQDGQHASELARAVGRAATSFTPNLDKLQNKGLIERRADPSDRRAVRIYLTQQGQDQREDIMETARDIDEKIEQFFPGEEFEAFQRVLSSLQTISLD